MEDNPRPISILKPADCLYDVYDNHWSYDVTKETKIGPDDAVVIEATVSGTEDGEAQGNITHYKYNNIIIFGTAPMI